MLRFDDIVFGPIHSRRLGNSLGINLLPRGGKLCNFDCIYCECGWNKDGREDHLLPEFEAVARALESKLVTLAEQKISVDSITFSGTGEPTLYPEFARVVDLTVKLRDKYCPSARVSVLSNATRLDRTDVLEALRKVDNPILKLDAPTDEMVAVINKPNGAYSVRKVVDGMKKMEGGFILQTMFLKGAGIDYELQPAALESWMDIVREVRPRKIMVYSLDRPAPQQGLQKMHSDTMKQLLKPLFDEGFEIQINE